MPKRKLMERRIKANKNSIHTAISASKPSKTGGFKLSKSTAIHETISTFKLNDNTTQKLQSKITRHYTYQ